MVSPDSKGRYIPLEGPWNDKLDLSYKREPSNTAGIREHNYVCSSFGKTSVTVSSKLDTVCKEGNSIQCCVTTNKKENP